MSLEEKYNLAVRALSAIAEFGCAWSSGPGVINILYFNDQKELVSGKKEIASDCLQRLGVINNFPEDFDPS